MSDIEQNIAVFFIVFAICLLIFSGLGLIYTEYKSRRAHHELKMLRDAVDRRHEERIRRRDEEIRRAEDREEVW